MKNNEIKLQQSEIFEIERFKNYKPIRDLLDSLMPTIDYEDSKSDCVNLPIALGLQARASILDYRHRPKNHGFKFVTRVKGDRFYVWKVDNTVNQQQAVNIHSHYKPKDYDNSNGTIIMFGHSGGTFTSNSGSTNAYTVVKE
tara:strand:+ start:1171 stop:1596 length:426 start_codon:yes stop_codon:yes gene_type:complete